MQARLSKKYREDIIPSIRKEFRLKNDFQVPKLRKVIINMGVGKAIQDIKILESAMEDLERISGQKPIMTRSRMAVSNFKLRENMPIGCKVTLRRERMYEFTDRLISVTLPRIRDFNGVSFKSFDRQGNYSLGLNEQAIFPEIDTGKIKYNQGMDITFVFDHGPKELTYRILQMLGIPFRKQRITSEAAGA